MTVSVCDYLLASCLSPQLDLKVHKYGDYVLCPAHWLRCDCYSKDFFFWMMRAVLFMCVFVSLVCICNFSECFHYLIYELSVRIFGCHICNLLGWLAWLGWWGNFPLSACPSPVSVWSTPSANAQKRQGPEEK